MPIIVKATEKPNEAVEYAIDVLTKNCVWSVNDGLRSASARNGSIDNSVANGDVQRQEADGGAGRQFAGERSRRSGRRPGDDRQLQAFSIVVPAKAGTQ